MRSDAYATARSKRHLADAARLRREEHALGVEPVQQDPEPLVLLADEAPPLDRKRVVRDLARRDRVAPDLRDGADVDVVGIEVGEEQAEPAQAAVGGAGAREQQDHLGLERLRRPDLAARHAPAAVPVGLRRGSRSVPVSVPASGSVTPNATWRSPAAARGRNVCLQPVVAEPHDRVEPEDREVQRGAAVHRRAARARSRGARPRRR